MKNSKNLFPRFKYLIVLAGILLVSMLMFFIPNSYAEETGIIKLSYKILNTYSDTEKMSMVLKLKARNLSNVHIKNVSISVLYRENMSIDSERIEISDINPGETILSPITFTISKKNQAAQESSLVSTLIWRVEYTKDTGEYVTEEIPYMQ